jgi:hypothetical protein
MPAFGKCGTNAYMAFTALHPHVKWPAQSEIPFDPAVISPVDLIRRHSPGVLPTDPNVWMVKDPSSALGGAPLAGRLLASYPSAALFVVTCDPTLLPFRWYRHYMERTLAYECYGGACGSGHSKGDPAGPADVLRFIKPRGIPSLIDLYARIYPFDTNCERDPNDEETFRLLRQVFSVGASLFGPRARCLDWDPTEPDSFPRTRHDEIVTEYASAGYVLGETMEVFFMEGWEENGVRYLERIHRVLGLPLQGYPWAKANGFRPVYSISQLGNGVGEKLDLARQQELSRMRLDSLSFVPMPRVSLQAAARECCAWLGMLGRMPPWEACHALACAPPAAPPPQVAPPPTAPTPLATAALSLLPPSRIVPLLLDSAPPPLPTAARVPATLLLPLLAPAPPPPFPRPLSAPARPSRSSACFLFGRPGACGAAGEAAVAFAAGCACLSLVALCVAGCRMEARGGRAARGGRMLKVQTDGGDEEEEGEEGEGYEGYGAEEEGGFGEEGVGDDEEEEEREGEGEAVVGGVAHDGGSAVYGQNGCTQAVSPDPANTARGQRAVWSPPRWGPGRGLPLPSALESGAKRCYAMDD